MYYTGLTGKYKVNRPLSHEDLELQLKQGIKLPCKLGVRLNIIKMSSSCMDVVDKYYAWKGFLSALMLLISCAASFLIIALGWLIFITQWRELSNNNNTPSGIALWIGAFVLFGSLAGFCIWLLLKESFRWTHYPIRLDRRNQMVHAFRLDGTVMSAPWKDIFFTLGVAAQHTGSVLWDVRGHILDEDRITVKETFAFGVVTGDQDSLRRAWEFFRRYMEEGPEEPHQALDFCLPIDQRKEPRMVGLQCLWLEMHGVLIAQILFFPLFLFSWLGRQFAIATCKIPVWPKQIEDVCPIEPGDPYVKDGRTNPPNSKTWFMA